MTLIIYILSILVMFSVFFSLGVYMILKARLVIPAVSFLCAFFTAWWGYQWYGQLNGLGLAEVSLYRTCVLTAVISGSLYLISFPVNIYILYMKKYFKKMNLRIKPVA